MRRPSTCTEKGCGSLQPVATSASGFSRQQATSSMLRESSASCRMRVSFTSCETPMTYVPQRNAARQDKDRLWASAVSWTRGLRLATKLREKYADRFLIVRYEDLVTDPVRLFRKVNDFVGVPFREKYLDVPHVNRSEAPHTWTSTTRGLTSARVYYYTDVLSSTELAAVDMLVWKEKLLEFYSDLPHRHGKHRFLTKAKALCLVIVSPFRYTLEQMGRILRHDPAWQLRRLLRRVRMITR